MAADLCHLPVDADLFRLSRYRQCPWPSMGELLARHRGRSPARTCACREAAPETEGAELWVDPADVGCADRTDHGVLVQLAEDRSWAVVEGLCRRGSAFHRGTPHPLRRVRPACPAADVERPALGGSKEENRRRRRDQCIGLHWQGLAGPAETAMAPGG